jgi:putative copper export protein
MGRLLLRPILFPMIFGGAVWWGCLSQLGFMDKAEDLRAQNVNLSVLARFALNAVPPK